VLAKHHRAKFFYEQGLFSNLSSFAKLEERIANLPTTKDRGDAFEIFAEAYLTTQKIVQAKEIWPFEAIPATVAQKLRLNTGRDMGVDGVYETSLGEYDAYQVKFRAGRSKLTWDELSTFMALTDQVSQRVLFTNCDDFPKVMNERSGFFCIRGSDLDRMEKRDFDAIIKWLESGEIRAERKQPLPHQAEALDAILPALKQQDRATAVMACGTGKTLVALWAAERMACQTVLVLLPSLSLVRQTLHEWLRETSWPELSYLCVCSDPSVSKGVDSVVIRQSELDFSVTTDTDAIRRFLARQFNGVRIIFSTYQSANMLAEAMDGHPPFDLGIFDEAHKTAGREGAKFGLALSDDNLAIHKRLFLTATPRHYNINKKDKEGDAQLVYSMDNADIYGPVVHTLSFAKAAEQGIICDYKVVISVVTSDMIGREMIRHGKALVDGDIVHAQQVANQIAIKQAVEKYGVSRIFSFHASVASARSFTSEGGEGINTHLQDFNAYHVNGAMQTAKREHVMQLFAESGKAIMSNARCLTEGVDVPAVDMVAFMSPKKSKVDIVQATGRAMRKSPNKEVGYVLIPLFLEMAEEESVEEALERTGLDDIWNVLQAMQEQDEALVDVIRQMREDKGRTGGFNDARLREKVETLGPALMLETLQITISAACVDRLGVTWDERYGELKAYKEYFGHCRVPHGKNSKSELSEWVNTQRKARKAGRLNDVRLVRLNDIGFVWDPFQAKWQEMYEALLDYKRSHGNTNVPINYLGNPELAQWVSKQRTARKKGKLGQDRIDKLNNLGFHWDQLEAQWEEMFSLLLQYKERFGHCHVPRDWKENKQLGIWVATQRKAKKAGTSPNDERIKRLNAIGFIWNTLDAKWEEMFTALREYKRCYGNCLVPSGWAPNPQLAIWVKGQRTARKDNRLSDERILRLNAIGFIWNMRDAKWEEMYSDLVEYKNSQADCNVPSRWKNKQLASWVGNQRQNLRRGVLKKEQIERLDAIGFIWNTLDAKWEEMFKSLKQYKAKYGDCSVPYKWSENTQLYTWISHQRKGRKSRTLSKERIAKLDSIGFKW